MDYLCQILDPQTERDGERQGTQAFGGLLADTTYYMRDRNARLAQVSFPGATWSEADARAMAAQLGGRIVDAETEVVQGLAEASRSDHVCELLPANTAHDEVATGTREYHGMDATTVWYIKGAKASLQSVRFPDFQWTQDEAQAVSDELRGTFVPRRSYAEGGGGASSNGLQESDRLGSLREAAVMELSAPEASKREGVHAVAPGSVFIRAGRNKTGRRLYESGFLKANLQRFDGALGHVDHPTTLDERQRPERSVATLATVARNPRWSEAQQAVVGDIEFIDNEAGRAMAETYRHPDVRAQAGLSIYWPHGVRVRRENVAEGGTVDVPVELLGSADERFNLDLVTRPTAGGSVTQIRESDDANNTAATEGTDESMDWEKLTRADIEANRPDLLQPAADNADAEQTPTGESDRIEQLERRVRQADAREVVRAMLDEAGLAPAMRTLIESDFGAAECSEGDAEALRGRVAARIEAVRAALKEAGGNRVQGVMAESDTGTALDVRARIAQSVTGQKPAAE